MSENQHSTHAPGTITVKSVRRAPRYGRFITVGVLLAIVCAAVLSQLPYFYSLYKRSDIFWVLIIFLVPTAVVAASAIAVFFDRRSLAKAKKTPTEPPAAKSESTD